MSGYQQAISQYKNIELESKVTQASPHELISLLLQGAKSHINSAHTCLKHEQIPQRGHHISKAISILGGLRACLDQEKGLDIAKNLDNLYEYVQNILLKANLDKDENLLNEANHLLTEIYSAWAQIKPQQPSQ